MFDLKAKLQKTRAGFVSPLKKLFSRGGALTPDDEDAIEELLLGSDLGVDACERILSDLKQSKGGEDYKEFLRREFLTLLEEAPVEKPPENASTPRALIMIGVNGVGKTTSVAKLTHYYQKQGKEVILGACDTFRAAAVSQLTLWAERLNTPIVAHQSGGDPAAVAFDACTAAVSRKADYVILDTAGRLHTKVNLMEELKKIKRICEKIVGPESVETHLVIDATLGQNSFAQAKEFTNTLGANGIFLTKLDSTSKGGIVIAIRQILGLPVRFIGVGEKLDDFSEFSSKEFIDALLG
jgi:fused signal recognition particle receptor